MGKYYLKKVRSFEELFYREEDEMVIYYIFRQGIK
jgi:hypothetical protein